MFNFVSEVSFVIVSVPYIYMPISYFTITLPSNNTWYTSK